MLCRCFLLPLRIYEFRRMKTPNFINLPIGRVELNVGQLQGLPANPRYIKEEAYEKLKRNIGDYPEMLEYRSLLVYPLDNGNYIIVGGNMRFRALCELGYKNLPCVVIPKDTTIERLKAYTILDNNEFGRWDWNMLANEWEDVDLDAWGLELEQFVQLDSEAKKESSKDLDLEPMYKIEIECKDEREQEKVYNELTNQGYICRVLTL